MRCSSGRHGSQPSPFRVGPCSWGRGAALRGQGKGRHLVGMRMRVFLAGWLTAVVWASAGLADGGEPPGPGTDWTPDKVAALLRRVTDKSHRLAGETNSPMHVFEKRTSVETLASDGTVRQIKEKKYEVTLRQGMTHNRLVAVDDKPLSAEESAVQTEKERRWRETYSARKGGGSVADRADDVINERLFARFEFTVTGEETIRGRRCLALSFIPKTEGLPEDRLVDRVINRLAGRVWIDTTEDEIVRADAETQGGLKVWGGLLGSLDSFRLHVDRERSPLGPWFNRHMEVTVRARKLFTPVHMRAREVGANLRRVESGP